MFARHLLPLIAAALAWPSGSAMAQDARVEAARTYSDCMQTAAEAPEAAIERARTWLDQGGGDPARHCRAIAHFNLGHYAEAGRQLVALARTMARGRRPELRADALAQAGQAWLLAGEAPRAEAAQSAALEIAPADPDLWTDRAVTRFQMARYWEAVDDLNRASDLAPGRAATFALRASAYRHLDVLELARDDVARALELDPAHPEALLERGILHRLAGQRAAARRDWLRVLRVAPDSPAAADARANLENMDVETGGED